jgi:hypothetical protein
LDRVYSLKSSAFPGGISSSVLEIGRSPPDQAMATPQ